MKYNFDKKWDTTLYDVSHFFRILIISYFVGIRFGREEVSSKMYLYSI